MFSKKIVILIFILFSVLAVLAVVFLNDEYSASARRAAFEADRTRYMSDILRITDGVAPVLWIEPKYSYENNGKYFDLSGNANHATQSTEANQPAVNPPGLEFDGGDDCVRVNDSASLDITNEIAFEAWVYPTSLAVKPRVILWRDGISAGDRYWQLYLNQDTGTISYIIWDSNNDSHGLGSAGAISINNWYHIICTYDGAIMKIYVNGVQDSNTTSFSANLKTGTEHVVIGANNDYSQYHWSGSIDSVRIYNIALTPAQIQNLYLAGLPGHR